MKKIITSFLLICSLIIAPAVFIGCGSGCKSPEKNAYVTSGVTHVAAVAGLRAWNDYLGIQYTAIATQATSDPVGADKRRAKLLKQEKQLADAWVKYQASQIAVLTAAQDFARVPPNDPASADTQDRLNAMVAASSATLSQVIGLLQQFGIVVK